MKDAEQSRLERGFGKAGEEVMKRLAELGDVAGVVNIAFFRISAVEFGDEIEVV